MERIRGAVLSLHWVQASGADDQASVLIVALLTVAAEHYVNRKVQRDKASDDLARLMLQVDSPLVAAVIAGCLFRGGIRLQRGPDGSSVVPMNVISGLSPVEFQFRSERDQVLAEVDAALQTVHLGPSLNNRRDHIRSRAGRPRDIDAIAVAADAYRQKYGVSPMFGSPANALPAPLANPAVVRMLRDELKIDIYVFDVPLPPLNDDEATLDWQSFAEALHAPFDAAARSLYRLAAQDAAPAAAALPQVFVSYCHDPADKELTTAALKSLESLQNMSQIRLWFDAEINPGARFDSVIHQAIHSSQVAVLLVSTPFLNSKYIRDMELPLIRQRHDSKQMLVCPLLLSPCSHARHDWLSKLNFPRGTQVTLEPADTRNAILAEFNNDVLNVWDKASITNG